MSLTRKELIMAKRILPVALGAGLLLAPLAILAKDASAPRNMGPGAGFMLDLAYSALDSDKDGKVTREEFEKNHPKKNAIHPADANKDGTITLEEAQDAAAKKARERAALAFKRLDSNGDGKFTPEEAKTMRDTAFNAIDANKDGALSKDELTAAHHKRMMGRDGHMGRMGKMKHFGPKGPMAPTPPQQ